MSEIAQRAVNNLLLEGLVDDGVGELREVSQVIDAAIADAREIDSFSISEWEKASERLNRHLEAALKERDDARAACVRQVEQLAAVTAERKELLSQLSRIANMTGKPGCKAIMGGPITLTEQTEYVIESVAALQRSHHAAQESLEAMPDRLAQFAVSAAHHQEHHEREAKLESEVATLRAELAEARRRLLTAAGDDLCRLSQKEIKAYTSGEVPIPPEGEFLMSCRQFHAQVAGTAGVNHNCLTLAQLIAENERQRAAIAELQERELSNLSAVADAAIAARDKLQDFKDWVHGWLDKNGVPADPYPEQTAATGCRISGRMEWLKYQRDQSAAACRSLSRERDEALTGRIDGPEFQAMLAKRTAELAAELDALKAPSGDYAGWVVVRLDADSILLDSPAGQRRRVWLPGVFPQVEVPPVKVEGEA